MSGIVAGVCAAAVVIATIALFRFQTRKYSRSVSISEEQRVAVWTGGIKTGSLSSTLGTARLELFSWGIRVRGLGLWRPVLPNWDARYGELRLAQHVKWRIANSGILMRTDGSVAPIVFTTLCWSEVLDALEARGVAVDRTGDRLRMADLQV